MGTGRVIVHKDAPPPGYVAVSYWHEGEPPAEVEGLIECERRGIATAGGVIGTNRVRRWRRVRKEDA